MLTLRDVPPLNLDESHCLVSWRTDATILKWLEGL